MQWCEKLKFARKVSRLTLRAVEEKTGISNAYLSQLENGQIDEPSFFKMMELIHFYNLDVSDFTEPKVEQKEIAVDGGSYMVSCVQCGTPHMQATMCPRCFGSR